MVCSNSEYQYANEYSTYDDGCNEEMAINSQKKLQEDFESVLYKHHVLIEKLKLHISKLSADEIFYSIEQICQFKIKSNEIEKKENQIEEELFTIINISELNEYETLKNNIRWLKQDIKQLKIQFEQMINMKKNELLSNGHILENCIEQRENQKYLEQDEEIELISSHISPRINQKVHLSNNIVSYMKGPVKTIVQGAMQAAEIFAKVKHATDDIIQTVNEGLERQKQNTIEDKTSPIVLIKPLFAEITSDWTYEGENLEQGFSSASLWMRNPQNKRILIKTQDLPMCAANEWLAYVLGRKIGLPVNKVQIGIYERNLVTLHNDVNQGHEKTIPFDELPKRIKKRLMTDTIMGSMDLFDHLIMNVDRNPKNILITIPDTTDIEDETTKLKIHFIDHSACFGMGKLNGISVMASKLHTYHLSVVKFDPIEEAKRFDQYLSKLSSQDRILMEKTLNRLAAITDQQIESWLAQVQNLLTPSQCNRIYGVLYRQCDIARRYIIQWKKDSRSLTIKLKETNQIMSEMEETDTYL